MFRNFLVIGSLFYSTVVAQKSLSPSDCVGSISSFPNCDSTNSILERCSKLTKKEEIASCICTQPFINAWVGCKSEFRQCGLSTSFDSDFDSYLVEWHGACDKYLTVSITTPPVSQLSATLNQGVCESIYESCDRWSRGSTSCTQSYTGGPGLTSCWCSQSMLSLASVCKIDGSRSCLQTTADITTIWEYRNCPEGRTILMPATVWEHTMSEK
ncbi:hypothetical protein B0J11DRAFT_449049 [Dendryphion nanum]|uniref:Uncharacterized protein n=1 Tax=Dendryphion nanum TaxID=256645 RepID=A0A9P9CXN3_9PLEO|nr:hypothetical protein B0J11DRAFT_449049 [Dendryphion nanum]